MADGAGTSADQREITTSRILDASPDRVFAAFADPARLARWWGPAGFGNTFHKFDLRPGGHWRFVMHGPDGKDYKNHSVFREVVRPARIVFEHQSAPNFVMTLNFDAAPDGKTRIGWTQRFHTPQERDRIARFAVDANEQNLDRLAAELTRGDL